MGGPTPGEKAGIRYCYTCADSLARTNVVAAQPVDAGLELQPTEDDARSSGQRGRIPQIAPARRGTSIAKIKPASQKLKPAGPAMPVRDEFAPEYAAGAIPQLAPMSGSFRRHESSNFLKTAIIGLGVCGLAVGAYLFATKQQNFGGTQQANASTAESKTVAAKGTVPTPPTVSKSPKATDSRASTVPKKAAENAVGTRGPAPIRGIAAGNHEGATHEAQAENSIASPSRTTVKTPEDADALLRRGKKNTAVAGNEDDEAVVRKPAKGKPVAPPISKEAMTEDEAKLAAEAEVKAANDAAEAAVGGPPGKKITNDELLGKKEVENPKKAELSKPENPFAPKASVPVTSTEPTVMPLDIERIGGNDKTMTEQIQTFMPNWRVRDSNFENSKIAVTHLERDNVVILNPLNDVLPARLIAVIEVPAKFASLRPVLLFEVSSAAPNKDWMVRVKAMKFDLMPKRKVVSKKDAQWVDIGVDLTPLANKNFEIEIEVFANAKGSKNVKEELGCIRNVRLDWTGKKK